MGGALPPPHKLRSEEAGEKLSPTQTLKRPSLTKIVQNLSRSCFTQKGWSWTQTFSPKKSPGVVFFRSAMKPFPAKTFHNQWNNSLLCKNAICEQQDLSRFASKNPPSHVRACVCERVHARVWERKRESVKSARYWEKEKERERERRGPTSWFNLQKRLRALDVVKGSRSMVAWLIEQECCSLKWLWAKHKLYKIYLRLQLCWMYL